MPSCVVRSCKNYATKLTKSQGITYHTFPRNRCRKDDWVQIIRNCRGEADWNASSASTVCSAHFDDADFKTTAKGLRCLASFAIPKRLLYKTPEIQAQSVCTPTACTPEPVLAEKFPLTGYCRFCAASDGSGKLINFQSDNALKNLVVNMSNRLNTNINFSQEHLPTTICSVCVKMLYTAYDFVVGIDLAQTTLNDISMRKYKCDIPENGNLSDIGPAYDFEQPPLRVPSATILLSSIKEEEISSIKEEEISSIKEEEISSIKEEEDISSIKQEEISSNNEAAESHFEKSLLFVPSVKTPVPPVPSNLDVAAKDFEQVWVHVPSTTIPSSQVSSNIGAATSNQNYSTAQQSPLLESSSNMLDTPRIRRLNYDLKKQRLINDKQRKNIRRLNQKVRRLNNRNESLKSIFKKIKEKNTIDPDLLNRLNENIVDADLCNNINKKNIKEEY